MTYSTARLGQLSDPKKKKEKKKGQNIETNTPRKCVYESIYRHGRFAVNPASHFSQNKNGSHSLCPAQPVLRRLFIPSTSGPPTRPRAYPKTRRPIRTMERLNHSLPPPISLGSHAGPSELESRRLGAVRDVGGERPQAPRSRRRRVVR